MGIPQERLRIAETLALAVDAHPIGSADLFWRHVHRGLGSPARRGARPLGGARSNRNDI